MESRQIFAEHITACAARCVREIWRDSMDFGLDSGDATAAAAPGYAARG